MLCKMCGNNVDSGEKSVFFHQICQDECDRRFKEKQCQYCGEKMDGETTSNKHCPENKYRGYEKLFLN